MYMKKLVFVFLMIGLSVSAMAQQPTTSDTTGHEKSEVPTGMVAMPQASQNVSAVTVLEPESMVLKYGVENTVKVKIEKTKVQNMILKVVNEEACSMRKGSELGTYYLTPKVKEGKVMVRVGEMDFMGAYYKIADLEFTIGEE